MAVENDYNLLAANLGFLHENINRLHGEVQRRLLAEKRAGLEPNETRWVNLMIQQLVFIAGPATQFLDGADQVWRSRPGVPVFDAQPPDAPDSLP